MWKNISVFISALIIIVYLAKPEFWFMAILSYFNLTYWTFDYISRKIKRKKTSRKKEYKLSYLFLFSLIPSLFSLNYYENLIGAHNFWLKSTLLAFIISCIVWYIFEENLKRGKYKRDNMLSIIFFIFFMIPTLGYVIAITADTKKKEKQVFISKKIKNKRFRSRNYNYYLVFHSEYNREESVEVPVEKYAQVKSNDTVKLILFENVFGYDFVNEVISTR